jgi:hypothetical protein
MACGFFLPIVTAVPDVVRAQRGPSTPASPPRDQPEPMRHQIPVRDVDHADKGVVHRLCGCDPLLLGAERQAEHHGCRNAKFESRY